MVVGDYSLTRKKSSSLSKSMNWFNAWSYELGSCEVSDEGVKILVLGGSGRGCAALCWFLLILTVALEGRLLPPWRPAFLKVTLRVILVWSGVFWSVRFRQRVPYQKVRSGKDCGSLGWLY